MLPLDLHVLGLPLAFILSQDQTLHRCFVNIRPNNSNVRPRPRFSRSNSYLDIIQFSLFFLSILPKVRKPPENTYLHNISMNSLFITIKPLRSSSTPQVSLKAGANIRTLFDSTIHKSKKNENNFDETIMH